MMLCVEEKCTTSTEVEQMNRERIRELLVIMSPQREKVPEK
jgi:hypothetical protein